MRSLLPTAVTALLGGFLAPGACDGESGDDPCADFNWRAETPGEVVCPRTDDCSCQIDDVCCVTMQDQEIDGASCADLSSCAGLAFRCDGPEDCGDDEVCCSVLTEGGGSSCEAEADCFGSEAFVMCRGGGDCPDGFDCTPAEEGAYFGGVAGYCAP